MKKIISKIILLTPMLLALSSCNEEIDDRKTFRVSKDKDFVVLNFADIQIDDPIGFEYSIGYQTIKKAIEQEKPDLITLSGDQAWGGHTNGCYGVMCQQLDKFEIPYFFVFGNHDREFTNAYQLIDYIESSKFGYIEEGPKELNSFGNYRIDIKNKKNKIVHSLLMMDSRNKTTFEESDYTYVNEEIPGMHYYKHNDKAIYGSENWDGVREGQIDWYSNQISEIEGAKSTVIMHAPTVEFSYAAELYYKAVNEYGLETANQMYNAQGKNTEAVSSPAKDFGLFSKAKELGSTKNFIVGHDHNNCLSVNYQGIQLTYGVKCGDGAFWVEDGSMSGCTKLSINYDGDTKLSQVFINPSQLDF